MNKDHTHAQVPPSKLATNATNNKTNNNNNMATNHSNNFKLPTAATAIAAANSDQSFLLAKNK